MTDTKPIALLLIATGAILGMAVAPFSSALRYIISDVGQFLVIFVAILIGLERVKFFTLKSAFGKALLFISVSFLLFGLGLLSMLYFNLALHLEVPPVPSFVDAFFLATIPIVICGLFILLKSISTRFEIATAAKVIILPAILFLSYVIFLRGALSQGTSPLEEFLSIVYPIGDAIALSFALVILSLIGGSRLSKPVGILCLALIIQVAADFSYVMTGAMGTYFIGCWVDMLYLAGFMTLGVGMYFTKDIIGIRMSEK